MIGDETLSSSEEKGRPLLDSSKGRYPNGEMPKRASRRRSLLRLAHGARRRARDGQKDAPPLRPR